MVNQEKIIKENYEELNHYHEKINSSIRYAKSLQERVFSSEEDLQSVFPDSFLLDMPKEIVGGDFFFLHKTNNKVVVCVADCTGHGVTGALLAVMGNNFLNVIMKENETNPAEIIKKLFNQWIVLFKKDQEHYDSMDLAVCTIHLDEKYIEFSALLRPLLMVSNGQMNEYKGEQFSFANSYLESSDSFIQNEIQVHKIPYQTSDIIYLSTDGICDQFGGENQKKFSNKRVSKILHDNYMLPSLEQKKYIKNAFLKWKGNNNQIDDVMLLGINL